MHGQSGHWGYQCYASCYVYPWYLGQNELTDLKVCLQKFKRSQPSSEGQLLLHPFPTSRFAHREPG